MYTKINKFKLESFFFFKKYSSEGQPVARQCLNDIWATKSLVRVLFLDFFILIIFFISLLMMQYSKKIQNNLLNKSLEECSNGYFLLSSSGMFFRKKWILKCNTKKPGCLKKELQSQLSKKICKLQFLTNGIFRSFLRSLKDGTQTKKNVAKERREEKKENKKEKKENKLKGKQREGERATQSTMTPKYLKTKNGVQKSQEKKKQQTRKKRSMNNKKQQHREHKFEG